MKPDHQKYLQVAITEARKAFAKNEVPIGAVIVDGKGEIKSLEFDLENGMSIKIFMNDENAQEMVNIIQNKLNGRN